MIEAVITTVLLADASVSALVGDRIYPLTRPQESLLPAAVMQRAAITPVTSLAGDSGVDLVRMRFSCYDKTLLGAKQLAAALRQAIVNSASLSAVTVMMLEDQDPETKNYRVILDFNIWERE